MKEIYNKSHTIKGLMRLFDRRILAVPEIQREFVWNAKKACALVDSIYRNYPIGTAMIWVTNRNNHSLLRHKLHILPQFDHKNKDVYFIIDGQQRLSVLYHLTKGDKIVNSNHQEVDFGRIFFSLYEEESDLRFEYLKRPDPERYVRLCDILDPYWRNKLSNLPKYKLKNVRRCRELILNYKFYMIFAKTDDLEEVRETFIRINSQGTPVSAADRAFTRATSFNLRHHVNEVRDSLAHGFKEIPRETLLMTIALANGANEVGERGIAAAVKKIEKHDDARRRFDRSWRHLKEAIGKAVDYIVHNFGVINYDFLPSQNMVTTFALFFLYNNNSQPNRIQKKELKKWFWTTAVGQRYAGAGFRRNVLKDSEFFKRMGRNKRGRFSVDEKVSLYKLTQTSYARKSGMSDAYFCLLGLQRPSYLDEGGHIPLEVYSTRANRNDKHHIFPRDLLKKNGISKDEYDSICNICIVVAKENQSIGKKRPSVYLSDLRHRKHFARVMKSHLIPYDQDSGLWLSNIRKGYRTFLSQRTEIIAKAFESTAGTKLFKRD